MVFGKLKQRLGLKAAAAGDELQRSIKAVGQSERLMSRSARIQQKKAAAAGKSTAVKQPAPPKLDDSGHLTTEEVVRRTSSSVVTQTLMVGTKQEPIHVEVRRGAE